jgi:uncharacterized membrane protein YjgN (DUF898 family)
MSGLSAASLSFRRASLALGLCLLAFLFAVEAKAARYGPVVGPGSDVRAAKALPADSPKLVERGVTAPGSTYLRIAFAALAAVTAACLLNPLASAASDLFSNRPPVFEAASFSPPAFVRPPPAR